MQARISRRDFIQLGAFSVAALAASPRQPAVRRGGLIGRVAYETISVFERPLLNLESLSYRSRDTLLNIYYPLSPLTGPAYNPVWYRINGGYVHSGLIQTVDIRYNQALEALPENGQLCRLTIPWTRPYNYSNQSGWELEQRFLLYYASTHWVTDIVEGPDGSPWYQITESWEGVQYYAAAAHLEPIAAEDLAPLSTETPPGEKRIEISLAVQSLTAYEGDRVVLRTPISSGVRNSGLGGLPTETPTGTFNIFAKLASKYMGDNRLTDTLGDRYLPGVPWTMFFAEGGYAIHGAYWHNSFGTPMSKGCVNVHPDQAQWLYRWVTPTAAADEWEATGNGTRVIVS